MVALSTPRCEIDRAVAATVEKPKVDPKWEWSLQLFLLLDVPTQQQHLTPAPHSPSPWRHPLYPRLRQFPYRNGGGRERDAPLRSWHSAGRGCGGAGTSSVSPLSISTVLSCAYQAPAAQGCLPPSLSPPRCFSQPRPPRAREHELTRLCVRCI